MIYFSGQFHSVGLEQLIITMHITQISLNIGTPKNHYFKLAWTKSGKSYCTTPGIGIGVGGGGVSKILKFLR